MNRKPKIKSNLLHHLILSLATILQKYVACGMVHGNICSQNIEIKLEASKEMWRAKLLDTRIVNYEFSYPFGKNKHSYMKLDQQFASQSMPPEMSSNLKYLYQNQQGNMRDLSKNEKPWSHDIWSLGIVIVEIISGCPIDMSESTFIETKIGKGNITKGLFAIPKLVLSTQNNELCSKDSVDHKHICENM